MTLFVSVAFVILLSFVGVEQVQAQTTSLKTGEGISSSIVSCAGAVPQDGLPACGWCSFVQLIGNLIQYSIFLAVTLSSLMFAYAGFLFLTNNGNPQQVTQAWSIFRRVIYGIVGILAAWLIVNAIMTKIAGNDNWMNLECKESTSDIAPTGGADFESELPTSPYIGGFGTEFDPGGGDGGAGTTYPDLPVITPSVPGDDFTSSLVLRKIAANRQKRQLDDSLAEEGLTPKADKADYEYLIDTYANPHKNPSCIGELRPCVDLGGMNTNTVTVLNQLLESCSKEVNINCEINVTRAAEQGYIDSDVAVNNIYTYENGYKVNIDGNQTITNYLTSPGSGLTYIDSGADGEVGYVVFEDKCGNAWEYRDYSDIINPDSNRPGEWFATVRYSVPDGPGDSCFN